MKHLVIGNFGYRKRQLDGQTIKTRVFTSALKNINDKDVGILDVGGINPIFSILKLLILVPFYNSVYFLPGKKQLLFLSPILVFYKFLFSIQIHYIVVGGWINTFAAKSAYIRFLIKKFDSINVELPSIVEIFKKLSYKAKVLTNFRLDVKLDEQKEKGTEKKQDEKEFKLVYFSRVMSEKGVFEAIKIIEEIQLNGNNNASLNIYGPLSFLLKSDEQKFLEKINVIDHIYYNGSLQPANICNVLSKYDFLIFPTRYEGEGVPGCIIDAKFSGVPTICTDWKYNLEIVKNGVDGMVFNSETFVDDVLCYLDNLSKADMLNMKEQSKLSSKYYGESAFLDWFNKL